MKTALILGSNGRFGRHMAEALWNSDWRVRIFDRTTDDLHTAARGVDVIVHGWNPSYPDWARDVPRLTSKVIAAAKASGATVLIPGNVYVYGQDAPGVLACDTPHAATNPLGRIRIEMEAAFRASGVPTIVLRAGDFIDTKAAGNWFDAVITAKVKKGVITAPGDRQTPHAWAYLPDLARAAVALMEKREHLDTFEEVLFPGHTMTFNELAAYIETATGRTMEQRNFPWWAIRLAAPFWPMGRHLVEMRYLWNMPHRLNGARFNALLPDFRATDPLSAIASALNLDVDPDKSVARGAAHVPAE